MTEAEKKLVEEILEAVDKLPKNKQYQLLGVAQGMEMAAGVQNERKGA